MLSCIEQEVCNKSFLNPNQKMKFNDYSTKRDPPIWIAADFECMNIIVQSNNDNSMDKLFVSKAVAVAYNIVKKSQITKT